MQKCLTMIRTYMFALAFGFLFLLASAKDAQALPGLCHDTKLNAAEVEKIVAQIEANRNLRTTNLQKATKREILTLLNKNPRGFYTRLNEPTLDSLQFQALMEEVHEASIEKGASMKFESLATSKVTKAKALAKHFIMDSVRTQFDRISSTIINDVGATTPEELQGAVAMKLQNQLLLAPRKSPKLGSYYFVLADNDEISVEINKRDIGQVRTCIGVDSRRDSNHLDPAAKDIRIDESGMGSVGSPAAGFEDESQFKNEPPAASKTSATNPPLPSAPKGFTPPALPRTGFGNF